MILGWFLGFKKPKDFNASGPRLRYILSDPLYVKWGRTKSDSATSPDYATRIAQLFGRIAQLGLRNLACAIPRIAQPVGLRNSACATAPDRLRMFRIVQLCLCKYAGPTAPLCKYTSSKQFQPPDNLKMTHAVHMSKTLSKFPPPWNFKLTWAAVSTRFKMISKFPPPMELQTDFGCPQD